MDFPPVQLKRQDLRQLRGLLREVSDQVPDPLTALGATEILEGRLLAFFCSIRCPVDLAAQSLKVAESVQEPGLALAGGFHTPVEKMCLAALLEEDRPVVLCPAREIRSFHLKPAWKKPLEHRKLLLLSCFDESVHRVTAETAEARNQLVTALVDAIFVGYASPGGRTEQLCRDAITRGKPILTLDHPANAGLLALGAQRLRPSTAAEQVRMLRLEPQ